MAVYSSFSKHADYRKKNLVSREDKVMEFMEEEMFLGSYVETWEFPSYAVLKKECWAMLALMRTFKTSCSLYSGMRQSEINGWEFLF